MCYALLVEQVTWHVSPVQLTLFSAFCVAIVFKHHVESAVYTSGLIDSACTSAVLASPRKGPGDAVEHPRDHTNVDLW